MAKQKSNKKKMPWDKGFLPSYSFFKNMSYENSGSPKKAIWKRQNPTPTSKDQHFGNVIEDYLFLKDEQIEEKYLIVDLSKRPLPESTFRKTENKEWLNELMLSGGEKTVLDQDLIEAATEIRDNVKTERPDLIAGIPQAKVIGNIEGVEYIGYLDNLEKGKFITDIKTCTNASAEFDRQIKSNFYDVQAVMYMLAEDINVFYWLAIENKPPYDFDIHFMTAGDERFENALKLAKKWAIDFKRCQEFNLWEQGYSFHTGVQGREIQVRRWLNDLELV